MDKIYKEALLSLLICRFAEQCRNCAPPHLEVNVNVISKDVHAEELAAADLTGVLLITVSQQVLVHVTPAGEHLRTQTALDEALLHDSCIFTRPAAGLTLPQMGHGDGSFLYLVPSSPLASGSSLFMCFGPIQIHHSFTVKYADIKLYSTHCLFFLHCFH